MQRRPLEERMLSYFLFFSPYSLKKLFTYSFQFLVPNAKHNKHAVKMVHQLKRSVQAIHMSKKKRNSSYACIKHVHFG